jgi:hypothetical protein
MLRPAWGDLILQNEWRVYSDAIASLRNAEIDFLVGGGFGLSIYTNRLRDTKDIDFFVRPNQTPRAVDALSSAGFVDYHATLPYDRGWIYRSTSNGYIVDIIFQMANRRATVDEGWFSHARQVVLKGELLKAVSPEELLWQKLYVLQRDRCDWPDILNLLSATGTQFDWEYLRERLGADVPLLLGVLNVFSWLSPDEAAGLSLPEWARAALLPASADAAQENVLQHRVGLLDSRRWYHATVPSECSLET